jgi:hypothetical protein
VIQTSPLTVPPFLDRSRSRQADAIGELPQGSL